MMVKKWDTEKNEWYEVEEHDFRVGIFDRDGYLAISLEGNPKDTYVKALRMFLEEYDQPKIQNKTRRR